MKLRRIASRIYRQGLIDTIDYSLNIGMGLLDYHLNPRAMKQHHLPDPDYEMIRQEMESAGIEVLPYKINMDDFHRWLKMTSFPHTYKNLYGQLFIEKALEHYLGSIFLELDENDVFLDIAASGSPWAQMAERLYGCNAYALDLIYPAGINGKKIGADATAMPLPDGFATKMALHCAFETFEGDADIRFISEAKRILSKSGAMVILPLYVNNSYLAFSSPEADRRRLDYQGAHRVWYEGTRGMKFKIRFFRQYSVESLLDRFIANIAPLSITIYYIENELEVNELCYCKFVALLKRY
jgi:hypothetical protein